MALPRLLPVEEFFADPQFSGASISPDGTRLAYLSPAHGHLNVWVRGIDEEHADAICVSRNKGRSVRSYMWTSNPRYLLYRSDTDGNEDWRWLRVDLDDPEAPPVDLTPLPPGGRAYGAMELSSEPGTLQVSMNKRPLFFDVFNIDIVSGETTLVREQPGPGVTFIGWDGHADFCLVQAEDGSHEFYAYEESTGERRGKIYRAAGHEFPLGVYPVVPTPDRKGLILGVYQDGQDDLSLVRIDRETGRQELVAERPGSSACVMGAFEHDFGYPSSTFLNTKGDLIAVRFVGDRPKVSVVDPGYAELFADLQDLNDGEIGWLSCDASERRWVVTFINDRDPFPTYLYDQETRTGRLLAGPFPQLARGELARMKAVRLKAREGLPLHGFLTLPVGVEPKALPLVCMVHGGPWAHDMWGYNREVQFLVNRGYAVLQMNFRGSSGYGRTHITAAIGEFAGAMHDDLIDACDWAVEQGMADPKRIGIFGGSYGGYAALVGITVTPDYFAAAVDYCGISSLMNFMDTLPEWVRPQLKNNFLAYVGDPADPAHRADMLARSPIELVDKVVTPLLIVQGANDVRVVQAEADAMVDALRERGVEVEYFVAQDEGHDFQNPENLIQMFTLMEKHFATYLGGRILLQ